MCQALVKDDVQFGIFINENHEIYNEEFISNAFSVLNEALQLADDEVIRQRVERVLLQPLYLYCNRHKQQAKENGKWNELLALMNKYNARPGEYLSIRKFAAQ